MEVVYLCRSLLMKLGFTVLLTLSLARTKDVPLSALVNAVLVDGTKTAGECGSESDMYFSSSAV